jgi:iron complex outermembrane receptor protein
MRLGAFASRSVGVFASGVAALAARLPALAQPSDADAASGGVREVVVVTGSRTAQSLLESGAAISVIESTDIATMPADDFGDLLRTVPGVNVAQTGVRDISVTARGATATLANTQLALLDGRSIYLDFFGFVAWDLLPVQTQEIDRIEVVRGPGSAVWGANAMSGVVHVITKRPKDIVGTTLIVGSAESSVLHAGVVGNVGYKVTAGLFDQSAYDRPVGPVPGAVPPQDYTPFANEGTDQWRVNAALDWDLGSSGVLGFGLGRAETSGILHSGIGPFDVRDGSSLSYVEADWQRDEWRVRLAGTVLDGDAVNLLTRRSDGAPLPFAFDTDTVDFSATNTSTAGARHSLTYGVDYRSNDFLLEIAPAANRRDEWGVFLQDEFAVTERLRWSIGARHYESDALADPVLAPRTSLVFLPRSNQSLRVAYGKAFRSPSAVNEYLDVSILQPLGPLAVAADADGNVAIDEEHVAAYEVGYTGVFRGLTLAADLYRNEIRDSIDFFVAERYGPGNLPAPGPTLPPTVIPCFNFAPGTGPAACPLLGLAGVVPSLYSYRNIGRIVQRGVEVGLSGQRGLWRWFANASWQDDPDIADGVEPADLNVPPEWRVNLGFGRDAGRYYFNVALNYQDDAYWADVLSVRARTPAFTQVGLTVGWRFIDERLVLKIVGQNIFDERVQQHIFGDLLSRRVEGQLSVRF